MRGPSATIGISRSAATSSSSGAVISVGQVGGDAGLEQRLARPAIAVCVGLEEVDAAEAVHLQVDEARAPRSPRPFGDETPTRAIRPSTISTSPGTRLPSTRAASTPSLIASSASRMLPPAAASRERAVSTSTPARSDDDRDLGAAVGRRERLVDLARRSAGRGHDDPPDAGAELLVRRDDVDHQVVEGLPEPDHRDRRDRVQDELLRRAGLQPRRAGEQLRADDDGRSRCSTRPASSRAGDADDAGGRGARGAGCLDRAEHVRRAPAGADRRPRRPWPRRRAACDVAPPASASSSAASCSSDEGASAPARRATTCPGAAENVASHSDASTAASRPEEPAPT